ncbi:helix-turn-helix domain-containing protein [Streptomyces sp. NPDC048436]|uniref:helix-turn-helix domain-containing protein n=1 Tax=Streptomyces sp. NPDC048436 TaxID=3365550 RepID=UPI003721780C
MSAAWQPLPETLPPEVRHFVEQLRLLKDRTGLSLIALGEETAYSKSSWQRYLNARQPPPRQAVAALCKVAGADCERFGARWELAVRVWPRGTVDGRGPPPAAEEHEPTGVEQAPAPDRREPRHWKPVACFTLVLIVEMLVGLLWILMS